MLCHNVIKLHFSHVHCYTPPKWAPHYTLVSYLCPSITKTQGDEVGHWFVVGFVLQWHIKKGIHASMEVFPECTLRY